MKFVYRLQIRISVKIHKYAAKARQFHNLNSMFTEILEYVSGYKYSKEDGKKYFEAEHTIKLLRMDQPESEFAKKKKKWQEYQINFTTQYQKFRNILPAFTSCVVVKLADKQKKLTSKSLFWVLLNP